MILNLTHNDLDGIVSALLVKESFGHNEVHTEFLTYYDINNLDKYLKSFNIDEIDLIVLTDLNIKEYNTIQYLNSIKDKVLLIDHHLDTQKNISRFKFETYINTDFCAAVNTYRYFEIDNDNLKDYARLTNVFDLHKMESKRYYLAETLNFVVNLINTKDILNIMRTKSLEEFFIHYQSIVDVMELEFEKQKESIKLIKDYGDIKLWNFVSGDTISYPNVSERIKQKDDEAALIDVIMFNYTKDNKSTKISCRSNVDYVNLPQIINECGLKGGGHFSAAGLTVFDEDQVKMLIKGIKSFIKEC